MHCQTKLSLLLFLLLCIINKVQCGFGVGQRNILDVQLLLLLPILLVLPHKRHAVRLEDEYTLRGSVRNQRIGQWIVKFGD
jgi:hypothetical protein